MGISPGVRVATENGLAASIKRIPRSFVPVHSTMFAGTLRKCVSVNVSVITQILNGSVKESDFMSVRELRRTLRAVA
jgi:hypothetical protein